MGESLKVFELKIFPKTKTQETHRAISAASVTE